MKVRWALVLLLATSLAAERRVIFPPGVKPVGPYSPGILAGDQTDQDNTLDHFRHTGRLDLTTRQDQSPGGQQTACDSGHALLPSLISLMRPRMTGEPARG